MYGLWLFKELKTEYGYCKVDIYRKSFTGSAIEIGGFVGDSLSIALENLDTITAPVGKSVCSFAIYDTEQVEYDDLFSPDATAFKVVVSTRVGSGAYVTRWSGYVTPDFFAENLSYRTPISISARDNIGYLNDVDFDLTATTITVRELIQSAFTRIAEDYPMSLSFVTQKQTAEGILAIDATISTTLLKEMTWGEALETILHDLGLQMRWVDNNTIAVLDLSQIPEYYATQGFNFVDASGYREIVPAWRQLAQEQSYGVRENFYEGQIDQEAKLEYVTTSQISTNILLYQPIALTQWRREGAIYLLNFFNGYNFDVDDNKAESIYITGVGSNATITDVLATKMVYSQRVTQVDKQMKFTFNLNDTLREPRATSYIRGEADSIFYLPYSQQSGLTTAPIPRPYQLKFRFNVFLRAEDGSEYVMREEWVNANTTITEQPFIEFKTKKLEVYNSGVNDAQGNPRVRYTSYDNEEEFSITIGSIPKAGILEFVVYPYTFVDDEYASVRDDATFQRGAKISDITFAIKDTATGIESNTLVDAQHNVKNAVSYSFGEVPIKNGDFLLYAGGLFNPVNLTALKGYQRNADATNYNLLELVGRELIHFNKRNYNRLSGTIRNLNKEPLMFNRLFVREGKKYAPYNYSLNVISNEMNITSMQEVEPYETATFNTIDSQITTGGGTVSGGNNTILQYSEEAGNEKRLYELQTATEQEQNDAYVLVDKAGFPEARKVHVSELGGIDENQLSAYLKTYEYLQKEDVQPIIDNLADVTGRVDVAEDTLKTYGESIAKNIADIAANSEAIGNLDTRVTTLEDLGLVRVKEGDSYYIKSIYSFVSEGEIISGRRASGSGSGGGGGISEITAEMVVDALGYVPYSSLNPAGYITSSALNGYAKTSDIPSLSGYATENWVSNNYQPKGNYLTSVAWDIVSGKPSFATVATSGKYSDLSGTPSSLPASDVYDWAKAVSKPSYAFSEITGKPTTLGGYGITDALSTSGGVLGNGSTNYLLTINAAQGGFVKFISGTTQYSAIGADDWLGVWITNKQGNYLNFDSNNLFLNNTYTFIHSGNIGSYNAGSATKLNDNTAFTAWGQTFFQNGVPKQIDHSSNIAFSYALFRNYDNTDYAGYIGRGAPNNNNIYLANYTNNAIIFVTNNITRASIEANGNVLIGTTTDNGAKLQVNGNLTATGEVISSRRASSSDARLKDNINRLITKDCLAMVRNLQPSSWDWKENGEHSMGFIAQDIEPLMPYAVTRIKDEELGQRLNLQYDQFFAPIVGAIQCLDIKVEDHETRLKRLETENTELKNRLSKYEAVWQ